MEIILLWLNKKGLAVHHTLKTTVMFYIGTTMEQKKVGPLLY
jgi:hypothetical protein